MKDLAPQRQNGGVFDVISYGADPTGAADSRNAFQAAADAAVAYNSATKPATLLIPPGSYMLNSTFTAVGGNITISAYGAYIFAGVAAQDLFRDWTSQDGSYTLNGSGLQILGGVWDMKGHTWAQGSEGASAFTLSNSSNILIRDVTIRNARGYHALDINTCRDLVADNVRMEGFKNSYEYKTNVKVASTANLAVASAVINGATVDGVSLATGDRILLKNQTATAENGIYIVAASGAASRATDLDASADFNDAAVQVTSGTTQAGMIYYTTATNPTVGTTSIPWATYWLLQCKLATTANIALTGAQSIDGTAVVTGDRILVKNQSTASQNGVYSANTAGAWTRVTDADAAAELNGKSVYVTNGTVNGGEYYKQTATIVTLGTDAVNWTTEYRRNRYFSEAMQLDDGPNDIPCKNITLVNSYMGPAVDGSGLLSYGKLIGSHTDSTNGLYTNIKVQGCTSVASLSNAIQGYSWADATISDSTILGSSERGIRMTFNASNVGPRLSISGNMISECVHHGIEIDGASGSFGDINVSNNVITSSVAVNPATGIRINAIDRINVANNSIKLTGSPSAQQGIYVLTVNGGIVSGNGIYEPGTYGIQTTAASRVAFNNNHVYASGSDGIYLTGATNKCIVSGNSIVGCGRTTNATFSGITVSNNASNVDNSIIANKFNKFGSGNEMLAGVEVEGTNPVDTNISGNTFGGDWSTTDPFANYSLGNNTSVRFIGGETFIARASSTTAVGTSATDITGLSMTVPVGTWRFEAHVFTVNTSLTALTATLVGPTATGISYHMNRVNGTTQALDEKTAFSSASTGTAPIMTSCRIGGVMTVTTGGTFKIQMTRTGTTCTAQIGSYLKVEPILTN